MWRAGWLSELTAISSAYKTLATGTPEPVVIWEKKFRGMRLNSGGAAVHRFASCFPRYLRLGAAFLLLTATAIPVSAREKKVLQYGAGLIVNVPEPEPEVEQVVEEVAGNTIIRGTKEYNKDEYVAGAVAATSTPVFPAWTEGGKVFYKVRKAALDPRNFKESADVGTLAVRYVVQPQGDKNTVLRIDALFVEDFRHGVHTSNGSVESAEYKDIQDHIAAIEVVKQETEEALQAKQERLAKEKFGLGSDAGIDKDPFHNPPASSTVESNPSASAKVESATVASPTDQTAAASAPQSFPAAPASAPPPVAPVANDQSAESLEQHVAELRQQVERLVKKPGAPLQSAPFHTASTLKSLQPGVEVLILISTPYWYGVETHDGDHGWIRRDQLEQVP